MTATLGRYSLVDIIARGGMAEVYLATTSADSHLRKTVAIKRILRQYSQSSEFIKMFYDEAKVALQLKHKNIVTVYDFGIDRGHPYLVMEYLPGKSLQYLKTRLLESQKQIPVEHVLFLMKEIASGLSYLHRLVDEESGLPMNLTHRDVTPQNIIIGSHGDIKIIDFGVAKSSLSESVTQVGVIKGKYGYLSPEQLHSALLDGRSDIYSLGVIFWELLLNRRLFNFQSELEYVSQLKDFRASPELVAGEWIDEDLKPIILRMLQPQREDRYQSAQELLQDLTTVLNQRLPGYTELQFAQFIREWIPFEPLSISQSVKTPSVSSEIKVVRRYIFKTPVSHGHTGTEN